MNGIVIAMDPTIVQVGTFTLRWYGLSFMLAVVAGVWLGVREAARRGIDAEQAQSLAMWAVVGGLVGARLFHVVDRWELYAADPLQALNLAGGGLAVYGGFVGGGLAGLLYALRAGLPGWKLADASAPGMALGAAVGRLACIPNGDAYGAPTNVPWAFIYTNPASMVPPEMLGVPTHPYALYDMIFNLALLGLLWRLRGVFRTDGLLFVANLGVYAVGRFLLTYYRVEKVWFWGLQEAQVVALLALGTAGLLLLLRLRTAGGPATSPALAVHPTGRRRARPTTSGGG